MATRELLSDILPVKALAAAVQTIDVNGPTIDTRGFDSLMLCVLVGVTAETLTGSKMLEYEVEHADDDGAGAPDAWEDCANADLSKYVTGTNLGTFAVVDDNAEDDAVYWTTYRGSKRFVRIVQNATGSHAGGGTPVAAFAIEGHPHMTPVALPTSQL